MNAFTSGAYKFCWILSACFLLQCSMPSGAKRSRESSDKKAAGGDHAQGKKQVESLDPSAEADEADENKVPKVAEKSQNGSPTEPAMEPAMEPTMEPPAPPSETPVIMPEPANPAPAQKPKSPNGAYLVNITCSDTMAFSVSLGNNSVNRSIVAPKSCGPLLTALDGKTFPSGGAPAEALVGGPTVKASCDNGTLNLSFVGLQGGASFDTAFVYNLNNNQVCQEIRNIINGLKL